MANFPQSDKWTLELELTEKDLLTVLIVEITLPGSTGMEVRVGHAAGKILASADATSLVQKALAALPNPQVHVESGAALTGALTLVFTNETGVTVRVPITPVPADSSQFNFPVDPA
ncbi:hypothetical protein KM176_18955 [Pseudooceanicola sp. CBS1P-1]|uniref:Uncharacterized protein n=1 Tax=Pseudooceanicola albus TaxID=2692189 RepID=A0A6L7G6C8_9RHOB|nr:MULTISPECIES: hypothetical protein [Pseudooceanicola]MBT9385958.1 hypothetical protein [Pseudooceanicola endophyticus]MXN19621.1 hypothetical protein [Pseudooceanicola albus]